MKPVKYNRTRTETTEGILVTEENIFDVLKHLLSLGCVTTASLGKAKYGDGLAISVTSGERRSIETTLKPGELFNVRQDMVEKAYPKTETGEWVIA